MSQEWRLTAACRTADEVARQRAFGTESDQALFAAQFCRFCPVREECLAFGVEFDDPGVFGGLTRRQRHALDQPRTNVAPHGTEGAYQRHIRHREPACDPCRAAHTAVCRQRRARRRSTSHAQCGTPAGYRRHLRDKQETCDRCRAAWAASLRKWRVA